MRTSRGERAALAAIAFVYVFLTFLTYDHIEEDAFVYFRQAVMIADGHGYVFNRGGAPVESASSLLWLLLLVALERMSIDLVLGAKAIGCACGVAILVLTHRLASSQVEDRWLRLLPAAVLAVSTPFVMNNQRGLETPLFGLLVLLVCLCCTEPRWFRFWWVPAALLLPARPEGFFVLLALAPVLWLRRAEWRVIARGAALLAAVALFLLAARFVYFQDFVPNPFYIKMRLEGWLGARRVHWLFYGNFIYLFALPLLLTLADRSFWSVGRIALASFAAVQIWWTVLAKDYMPYYRHMAPALPFVLVLVASGLDHLASRWGTVRPVIAAGVSWVALTAWSSQSVGYFQRDFGNPVRTALASFVAHPLRHAAAVASKIRDPFAETALDPLLAGTATIGNTYQVLVGEFLRRNYPEGAVIVYDQMGQTPFYAGPDKVFLDSWGLTDRTVARHYFDRSIEESGGGSLRGYVRLLDWIHEVFPPEASLPVPTGPVGSEQVLDYLFERDPDLILINSFLTLNTPYSVAARLRVDPRLARDYFLTFTLAGFVEVYERAGRALRTGPLEIPRGLDVRTH